MSTHFVVVVLNLDDLWPSACSSFFCLPLFTPFTPIMYSMPLHAGLSCAKLHKCVICSSSDLRLVGALGLPGEPTAAPRTLQPGHLAAQTGLLRLERPTCVSASCRLTDTGRCGCGVVPIKKKKVLGRGGYLNCGSLVRTLLNLIQTKNDVSWPM